MRERPVLRVVEKPKELHPLAAKILRGEPLFEDSKPEPKPKPAPRQRVTRKSGPRKTKSVHNAESKQRMLAKRIRKDGKWFHPDAPHGELRGCTYYQCYCADCYSAYREWRYGKYPPVKKPTKACEITWGVKLPEVRFPKRVQKSLPRRPAPIPKVKRVRLPEVKFKPPKPPKVDRRKIKRALPEIKFKPPRPPDWHRVDAYVYKLTPEENEARIARNKRSARDNLLAERVEIDGRKVHPRAPHGTVKGVRYYCCGCVPCNKAWYEYRKDLKNRKR